MLQEKKKRVFKFNNYSLKSASIKDLPT